MRKGHYHTMEKHLFRIASDLHSEFWRGENLWPELLPPLESDKDSFLLLAGDIGTIRTFNHEWFQSVADRFAGFMHINGNHEYYGSSILDNDPYLIEIKPKDNINVIGATLWTDFDGLNPVAMTLAQSGMNDYRSVRDNSPSLTADINKETVQALTGLIKQGDVVVTHHPPSYKSITPGFEGSMLNPAFLNNLDQLVVDKKPSLWVHGHVHSSHDYVIGDTRIVCNPYGYFMRDENKDYNPELVIELDG